MQEIIFIYYLVLNAVTFLLMGWDKRQSQKRGRRISEKSLLLLGILGGFFGAWVGMRLLRHKTKHHYFAAVYLASFLLHIVIIWGLWSKFGVVTLGKLI